MRRLPNANSTRVSKPVWLRNFARANRPTNVLHRPAVESDSNCESDLVKYWSVECPCTVVQIKASYTSTTSTSSLETCDE